VFCYPGLRLGRVIANKGGTQLLREEKVAVVEAYLKGLARKDISKIPFAMDITFEGPRVPPLPGGKSWLDSLR
jgi:hypothetical protein